MFLWPRESIFNSEHPEIQENYYSNVRDSVNRSYWWSPATLNAYNSPQNQKYIFEHTEGERGAGRRREPRNHGLQVTVLKAPLPFYKPETVDRIISDLKRHLTYASSLSISFGFMHSTELLHTAKYKYASNNTQLLDEHINVINRNTDLERLRPLMQPQKVWDKLEQDCVKSYRVQVIGVFEVMIKIWHTRQPVGCDNETARIMARNNRHCLVTFGTEGLDDLCFFRCLVYHLEKKRKKIDRAAKKLKMKAVKARLVTSNEKIDVACNTYKIEDLFKVNIQFYDKDGGMHMFNYTQRIHETTLRILLVDGHCMVIKDIYAYFGKFCCVMCNKFYGKKQTLAQHKCSGKKSSKPTIKFRGGTEQVEPSMFDYLQEAGVPVMEDDRYNRGFIAFDVECMLQNPEQGAFEKRNLANIIDEHVPCSIALAYSGDDTSVQNPDWILTNGNSEELVGKFVNKMILMYKKHYERQLSHYGTHLENLERVYAEASDMEVIKPYESMDDVIKFCSKRPPRRATPLGRYRYRFYNFVFKLPVVGFNSSSYDLNVLREWLFPALLKCSVTGKYNSVNVLKRRNRYLSVETAQFKFLDAYLFVAAGTSLKSFMKSQGEPEGKLEFPYKYLTSLEVLNETHLPPPEAWIKEDRLYRDENNVDEKKKMYDAAVKSRQVAQEYWNEKGLTTFEQYLQEYNVTDVRPSIKAFEQFAALFKAEKFDVFSHITLPSIAKAYGLKSSGPGRYFVRFDKKSEEAYEKIRKNLYGGVCMVWNRHVECGKTKVRLWELGDRAEFVQSITGYDMSACYLMASSEEHMTGPYFVRDSKDKFEIKSNFRDLNASVALEYLAFKHYSDAGLAALQHKWLKGEKRFLTKRATYYRVDGYLELNGEKVVFEYNGCYFHCHSPCKNQNLRENKYFNAEKAAERLDFIRDKVTRIITLWECDWWNIRRQPEVQEFLKTRPMYHTYSTRNGMTAKEALKRVQTGTLKGLLEIDAYVPMAEAKQYRDINPFFYRAEVKWDMIGSTMQNQLQGEGRKFESREMLLNPPFCVKLLLPHQYVKFLLERRIKITKVHYIIEFPYASRPYEQLAKEISDKRQAAAEDPAKEAEGLKYKLIGNSIYDTSITNPYEFTTTRFVSRETAERELFQRPICNISQLDDDTVELTVKKKITVISQPIQFGMVVYALSKLRVLQFATEWFRILEYAKYDLVLSDTDSVYMSFARKKWEECCKQGVTQEQILQFKKRWFALEKSQSKQAGLWHEEFSGKLVIALAPKLYIAVSDKKDMVKIASRGISAKRNRLDVNMYREQLYRKADIPPIVVDSFKLLNDRMITWRFISSSFNASYVKRQVLPDLSATRQLKWNVPSWAKWHDESCCVTSQSTLCQVEASFQDRALPERQH